MDLFCSVYISWPIYYLVTRSFFLPIADRIPLTYAHIHKVSCLLENIRLSFSSTSSIFNFLCNTNFLVLVDGIKCIVL